MLALRISPMRVGDVVTGRVLRAGEKVDIGNPGRLDHMFRKRSVPSVDGGDGHRWIEGEGGLRTPEALCQRGLGIVINEQ